MMHSNHPQVFIAGPFDDWVARLFYERNYRGTKDLHQADLVVFTGGEDVNPELYHEVPLKGISFNTKRDEIEKAVFDSARNIGTPMVGICRGAQLLNVLGGGRLFQHVDNHTQGHYIKDLITDEVTLVTSTHHQQMRPHQQGVVVAKSSNGRGDLSSRCTVKLAEGLEIVKDPDNHDVEVVWYPDDQTLCFQPHPEYPTAEATRKYFWSVFDRYIQPIINEGMAA